MKKSLKVDLIRESVALFVIMTKYLTNYLFWYKWSQLFKTEMERNKLKKFFIHANSTHSISLIKDFKIRKPIYV